MSAGSDRESRKEGGDAQVHVCSSTGRTTKDRHLEIAESICGVAHNSLGLRHSIHGSSQENE